MKSEYGQQTGLDQEMTLTKINHIPSSTPLVFLHLPLFKHQAATVFKKSIVFTFSHVKAYVSKIDLAVKYVKVILGSSFDQTMMGWSPKCYIPCFMKIGLPVLEKKTFEWFLLYMGGQPSWSCDLDFTIKLSSPLPMDAPHKISL